MKRFLSMFLVCAMLLCLLTACADGSAEESAEETIAFTDSLGRTVQLPKELTRVAPSGAVATMILATIAPE